MTAIQLHQDLLSRGFAPYVDGEKLYVPPQGKLTAQDCERIRQCKAELVAILKPVEIGPVAEPVIDYPVPYINENGSLRIPFNCAPKYRHWAGGQSLVQTLAEIEAPLHIWRCSIAYNEDLRNGGHSARCKGEIEKSKNILYCVQCGYYATRKDGSRESEGILESAN